MNFIAILKQYLSQAMDLIKTLFTGNIIEIHLKKKATLQTNRVVKISNIFVIILIVLGIVIFWIK